MLRLLAQGNGIAVQEVLVLVAAFGVWQAWWRADGLPGWRVVVWGSILFNVIYVHQLHSLSEFLFVKHKENNVSLYIQVSSRHKCTIITLGRKTCKKSHRDFLVENATSECSEVGSGRACGGLSPSRSLLACQ